MLPDRLLDGYETVESVSELNSELSLDDVRRLSKALGVRDVTLTLEKWFGRVEGLYVSYREDRWDIMKDPFVGASDEDTGMDYTVTRFDGCLYLSVYGRDGEGITLFLGEGDLGDAIESMGRLRNIVSRSFDSYCDENVPRGCPYIR